MSKICYIRSGSNSLIRPDYGPCDPRAGSISLCCGVGDTCLTNGLCLTRSGKYYSGGCTDSTYEAAICPNFCTSGYANRMVQCPSGAAVKAGDLCCSINGTAKTCCDTASNGLGLGAAVFSAMALSAVSVETRGVPAPTRIGATIKSSRGIESSSTPTWAPKVKHAHSKILPWFEGKSGPLLITTILVIMGFIGLFIYKKSQHLQRLHQRLQRGIVQRVQAMCPRPLDTYIVRRLAAGPARLSPRRADETEGATEFADLRHRRGSSSVPPTQRGVVAENRGSETRPEDTAVHGQDPRVTTDDNSLSGPPAAARSFT